MTESETVRIKEVKVTGDTITARLVDGRVISVPLAWSWRLSEATPKQRAHYEIIGDRQGVHWPEIDEDISNEDMLYGIPAKNLVRFLNNLNLHRQVKATAFYQKTLKRLPEEVHF